MIEQRDAYWDALGIEWTAIRPDPIVVAPRIKWRLRWQTIIIAAVIFVGVPISIAGCALGVWTAWLGASTETWNFVARGIAIFAISLMSGFAAWSFRSALRDETKSLSAMIELALVRAGRWYRALQLGYFACGVAGVLGTVGYGLRVHFGAPPAMSLVESLSVLTVLALVLFFFQARIKEHISKYRHLKHVLLQDS